MWRPEDEALLARIEDELLMARLWQLEAPGTAPPHARAAGLFSALRATEDVDSVAHPLGTDTEVDAAALQALVRRREHRGLSAAALHHLAVFHARVAHSVTEPEEKSAAQLRSLAAWLALASEGKYLKRLANAVVEDAGSTDVGYELLLKQLRNLAGRARKGARELSDDGRVAMRVLARVSDACKRSGCTMALQKRIEAECERQRSVVVEEALTPISAAITDANARGVITKHGPDLMKRIVAVWHWSDWDEHVERYAIDEATPLAWSVYQLESEFDDLRRLLTPLEPLVDNLTRRVEGDRSRIAYAAPIAQMFVFRSEMQALADDQIRWAEKAVAVCPTHRNGRLILARLLVWQVRTKLDEGMVALFEKPEMVAKLDRAEALYAHTDGIDDLRGRIENMRWWKGGG